MTAIDRTAYLRPGMRLSREELGARYHLTQGSRMNLAVISMAIEGALRKRL